MKQLISLKPYTMFRMGGQARYFFEIKSEADLEEALSFVKQNKLPIFVLGGGSNILLSHDDIFEAAVLKMEILGFQVLSEDNDKVVIKIGAGENWDSVVAKTVEKHWLGLEALSAIPGTVGGTPIQNVGAYGAEISDVLISLEAYEIATGEMRTLTNEQCEFKYRDSVFKQQAKDKFVITSVTLELKKLSATQQVPIPNYP
ncbi:MAG TPA: UDP-N-acetylmuramate dehydrogenase, partial [Patescibacteria group bacterium]|nr:UDP-N-acetylmuramate dehydrogenase [Patescibacteria group bacterium]